jgi:hypothetical protein
MKEFFDYKVIMVGCGIPEVTIEGSVADWEKINKRLDHLSKYDLKWWTSELKPVIQKIIDTKKGKLDKAFWMNMVKYHKIGVYGAYDGIDGWLLKFYPYLEGGKSLVATARKLQDPGNIMTASAPAALDINPGKIGKRTINLKRSEFKKIKSVGDLPKEMACVPFIFEIQDDAKNALSSSKMEFWAGFMGIKQNQKTFNVKPEIGWAVNSLGR